MAVACEETVGAENQGSVQATEYHRDSEVLCSLLYLKHAVFICYKIIICYIMYLFGRGYKNGQWRSKMLCFMQEGGDLGSPTRVVHQERFMPQNVREEEIGEEEPPRHEVVLPVHHSAWSDGDSSDVC